MAVTPVPRPSFANRAVIVTGAGGGIGRAAALAFADAGAKLLVTDINREAIEETAEMIAARGATVQAITADVTRAQDVSRLVETTVDAFGRIDAAFNNAGVAAHTNLVDCTEEEWDRVMAVNLRSVWLCLKYEIAAMCRTGGGAIVNNASQAAVTPPSGMAAYSTSKAGVVALTRSAALDFGPQNIRVNAILPGPTLTTLMRPASISRASERLPLRRIGQPDDQADAVLWLCSDHAAFVTGAAVPVDGGLNLL